MHEYPERQWSSEKEPLHQQEEGPNPRQVFSERLPAKNPLHIDGGDRLGDYQLIPSQEEPIIISAEEIHQHRSRPRHGTDQKSKRRHPAVEKMEVVMKSVFFQILTVVVIGANAICIGMETDMPDFRFWSQLEWLFLVFFSFELTIRVVVIKPINFFTCNTNDDPVWNIFDFLLVMIGFGSNMICLFEPEHAMSQADATLFRVIRLFRILRILRVVRVFRFLKQLYLLAYGFFEGAMAVFWVAVLASSIMYCCSIVLVRIYGGMADQDPFIERHFGSVPDAMFSLFEIMSSPTLQHYKEHMYDYPLLIVFIIIYVIFGSFGINGLLTGVISESILDKNQARIDEQRIERETKRRTLHKDTSELFDLMDTNFSGSGSLTCDEIVTYKDTINELCKANGVTFMSHDLDHMFDVMDYDDNGLIEKTEFVNGLLELCDEIRPMSIMELNSMVSRSLAKVGRTENKVDAMFRSIEDLAFAKRKEAEGADALAVQMKGLLESHQRALEEKDAAAKLQKVDSIMHKMKDLVTDVSLKATSEAQVTQTLASNWQQLSPQRVVKGRARPRRQGRLDPNKFQSAPPREEQEPDSPAALAPVCRRRRKSQTHHFILEPSNEQNSGVGKEAPAAGVKFANGIEEISLQPILESSPSPKSSSPSNSIRRSTTSPDLLAPTVSPGKLDSSEKGKAANERRDPKDIRGPRWLSVRASQAGDLFVQGATPSSKQASLGESCERLVQEAMRHVDASSEIQRALESTKSQTMGEASNGVKKGISSLPTLESHGQEEKHQSA